MQAASGGLVTGIRYAWGDNPCCGVNNRTWLPCPPMSCPLLVETHTHAHTQGGVPDTLPEPVVPFLATVVHGGGGGLSCVCDPPAVC